MKMKDRLFNALSECLTDGKIKFKSADELRNYISTRQSHPLYNDIQDLIVALNTFEAHEGYADRTIYTQVISISRGIEGKLSEGKASREEEKLNVMMNVYFFERNENESVQTLRC